MEHLTIEDLREMIKTYEKENDNLHRVCLQTMQENTELRNRINFLEAKLEGKVISDYEQRILAIARYLIRELEERKPATAAAEDG